MTLFKSIDDGDDDFPEDIQSADTVVPIAINIPDEHHKLQSQYWMWASRFRQRDYEESYEKSLKLVAQFGSVEQFWATYCHFPRPSDLPMNTDVHLFKLGIKPTWEDENNSKGGRWVLKLKKGVASRCWEDLVMAVLGEQFMVGEEITGCVVSIRQKKDIISLWNRTASDSNITTRIRDTLRRVLNLPRNTVLDYDKFY